VEVHHKKTQQTEHLDKAMLAVIEVVLLVLVQVAVVVLVL
jgi:hypothetical protein